MSTPSNTLRDSPLQLPSKPPDPPNAHNPPEELREVIPSNSTSGDPEDPAVLDEIALMQKLIRQHQEKLDALQKRKRSNAGSNPPSDTGEAGADDSDQSSHRPKKTRKLEDPAASTDRAREALIVASRHSSEATAMLNGSSGMHNRLWATPTQILAKGLGMILPEDGGPPRPEASTLPHAKLLEKAEKQSAEDEDEEQEVQTELAPKENVRAHKRALSASETDSSLLPDSQAEKRAHLLLEPTVAPSAKSPSVPLAPPPHPRFLTFAGPEQHVPSLPRASSPTSIPSLSRPPANVSEPTLHEGKEGSVQSTDLAASENPLVSVKQSESANTKPSAAVPGNNALGKRRRKSHRTQQAVTTEAANDADESSASSDEDSTKPEHQNHPSTTTQAMSPDVDESDDPEMYGKPKSVRGKFATRFYPDRATDLQIPTGPLSERQRQMRYKGKTDDEIRKICEADAANHEVLPKYARAQIKGIKRAYFDTEVHCWLSPRIYNLSLLEDHSAAKNTLQATVIRELFGRFPDLHPDNLYLRDATMEAAYISKIKSSLTSHTSSLKRKSATINRSPVRFRPVLFTSIKKAVSSRPEDIWFQDPIVKACLADWWAEVDGKVVSSSPPDIVHRTRLSRYMTFRKGAFKRLPADVRVYYRRLAQDMKGEPEAMDAENLILHGIPFIQSWLHEFSLKTKIPFMLVLSTLNPENPTQIDTYCQTGRGDAPSDVPDFKNMDNDWMTKNFIPRWRSYAAKAFVGHDDAAADLTFEVIESALVDDQLEEPDFEPEQVEGFEDPEAFPSVSKMREVVASRVKEGWNRGYASRRVDYEKVTSADVLDPARRPRVTETIQTETIGKDGSTELKTMTSTIVVPLTNPNGMGIRDLRAWFNHLTNPNVAPANRFAFRGELAKLAAKVHTIPTTIQKALVLSDDSVDGADETSSSDNDEAANSKPRTKSSIPGGRKGRKAKSFSEAARLKADEEPEAVESNAPSSKSEGPSFHESDDGPTTSGGEHGSDGVPQNRPIKSTRTRSERISQPPNREQECKTTSEGADAASTSKRTAPRQSGPARKKAAPSTASSAPENGKVQQKPAPFIFFGSILGKDDPQAKNEAALPPRGFSRHIGTPQYQESMRHIFDFINDIDVPIPQMLELFQSSNRDPELIQSAFDVITSFVDCALDELNSAAMPMSTSNVFGIIARYLDFLRRAETQFKDVRPSPKLITNWLNRLALAGWRSLVLTYCMSTARGFLSLNFELAPLDIPPAINLENAVQVVTNWWYLSLRKIARDPSLELDMLNLLPEQWQPFLAESPPCVQLSTFDGRWYQTTFSPALESQVDRYLEITLEMNLSAFEGISILDQMQVLTSLFAVHAYKGKTTEAPEDSWLPYLERLVQAIQISCVDTTQDSQEDLGLELRAIGASLNFNNEVPPEKPPTRHMPRRKRNGDSAGTEKLHSWALGDVAEILHHGKRLKIQVIEQDDRLSMVNFNTRKLLKTRHGVLHALPDPKDAKIIKVGTELDRTNPELRCLPSFLPPKPQWDKPETYDYKVVLSDDERAESAAVAEANRPQPSVVDPELDARQDAGVNVGPDNPEDAKGEGGGVDDKIGPVDPVEQERLTPKRKSSRKAQSTRPSSAPAAHSQSTADDRPSGPLTRQHTLSNSSPKKSAGAKPKQSVKSKSVRIQSPGPAPTAKPGTRKSQRGQPSTTPGASMSRPKRGSGSKE
ncbi:hypothetical protein FRC05_004933 [Tulasnella sp. 425]|nr:hypothetical protein FRC05_004933 [Tulasnella sp. 425]